MTLKKEKVIFYIDTMQRGGAQRVMSVLANNLSDLNYDVILINDFKLQNPDQEYAINPQVKRFFLRENIDGNVLTKNFERVKSLRKIVKREKPSVIVSFLGHPNIRMLLATFGIKCRKIVSVRNDPNKEYGSNFIKRTITNLLFLLADGCVFQTPDAAQYFYKKIQNKSQIIFNPVDDKFYNIIPNKNKKNIINVGRLEPQKNHKLLIDAYANIFKDFADDLYLYGEGSKKSELQNYVNEKGLVGRVHFMGNVIDIDKALSDAKVFVLSSDYEGMPNALMEAMVAGVACISTDCPCGGPRLLIQNSKQGLLVPCNDVNAMSKALRTILNDDCQKIGENARMRSQEFRTNKILAKWNNYLFK